jgi:hypothetical protein
MGVKEIEIETVLQQQKLKEEEEKPSPHSTPKEAITNQ